MSRAEGAGPARPRTDSPVPRRTGPEDIEGRHWYHTLELPGGLRTPGEYDVGKALHRLPMPASLAGMRCLDVGTHDGFWAFEMERRHADEVIAVDVPDHRDMDFPAPRPHLPEPKLAELAVRREAFDIAHRALGSRVERRFVSVYDLSEAALGRFDFAVIGTLLLHLRDPVGALMAISKVLDGELLVNDAVSLSLSLTRPRTPAAKLLDIPGSPFWWMVNVAGLRRLVRAAGFSVIESGGPYFLPNGPGWRGVPVRDRRHAGSSAARLLMLRLGLPHGWVLAGSPGPEALTGPG